MRVSIRVRRNSGAITNKLFQENSLGTRLEFNVMTFGLKNAPGVFQHLMQRVLMDLNPKSGPDFVSSYIDDVLVFSETFKEHVVHLRRVLDRLIEVNLKLKPPKCHLICPEVEYMGHLITPHGIFPNPS